MTSHRPLKRNGVCAQVRRHPDGPWTTAVSRPGDYRTHLSYRTLYGATMAAHVALTATDPRTRCARKPA